MELGLLAWINFLLVQLGRIFFGHEHGYLFFTYPLKMAEDTEVQSSCPVWEVTLQDVRPAPAVELTLHGWCIGTDGGDTMSL